MKEEYEEDEWDESDWCYECTGYGDDYYIDDNGEMQCACDDCIHASWNNEDD